MKDQQAFPLSWPPSWKRFTGIRPRAKFLRVGSAGAKRALTLNESCTAVLLELKRLGVGDWNVVISTNVRLRPDGLPYSNQAQPTDPGAAVYFKITGKDRVLACDKWDRVEDNLMAIAKDIEAQRGRIRWGVGSVDQAFAGYTALPPVGASNGGAWWDVLGTAHDATFEAVQDAYREKAKVYHPDNKLTGDNEKMAAINYSWDQARKAFNR